MASPNQSSIPPLILIWNCWRVSSKIEKQSELKLERHSSLFCRCLCILDFLSFFTFIDSSFKVVTGFANLTSVTSRTNKFKFINQKRLQKIGSFIFSWEIDINFKRSKNNFKTNIFANCLQISFFWTCSEYFSIYGSL